MTKKKTKGASSNKIKWMQRFFAVAGNIAPHTTIRILVKLLYTPQKRELKPAHIECMNKADKFKFEVEEFRNPKKKLKLQCYSWGKGEKTVLLVHGWDAKAMDFYKIIPVLVEQGYKVISFDGPGHGKSEGERSNLVDFKEIMYKIIKEKIGVPYAIIGHSMGGGSSTYLLMEYDIRVKRLVTIAIPIISKRFFDGIFTAMKVPGKMQKVFFKSMAEEFGEPIERYNLAERKEPIQADKILMLYDDKDEVISTKDVNDYLANHKEIEAVTIPEVGHYSIIKSKLVIEEIVRFLR